MSTGGDNTISDKDDIEVSFEGQIIDSNLIHWSPHDPENPFNFPLWRKAMICIVVCIHTMWVAMCSSSSAAIALEMQEEFHVSPTLSKLPVAIFLYGMSVGPVILTPLAENFTTIVVCRFFCGVAGATVFNSVGNVPDLWKGDDIMGKENMWTIGLGDSSIVLLTHEGGPTLNGRRLTPLHNTSTPSEYARIKLAHPTSEYNVLRDQRVLGVLSVTRALGDFSYKLPSAYSKHLFSKVRSEQGDYPVHDVSGDIISPPYIIATSDVRHIDLASIRHKDPILLLYTDGVNNIIEGRFLFRKDDPSKAEPAAVLGALLSDHVDSTFLENVFDHEVESRWNVDGNRAVEILGNLLGGRDAVKMKQITTPALLSTTGESDLYVDDTTIVFCPLDFSLHQ
ncbi:hypothetical protein H0H93_007944 [Arthromyces matolae]|nr:hypothetical protein H0H93_007944 [Arthromyces matolae]